MLRRIFSCFLFLCFGLVIAMFFLFSEGVVPQYQETLIDEVQSLTNMQDEALLNGVLSPIDHTIAQIVASDDHDLAILAGRDEMELRDAVDAFRYLDAQTSLSGLYYSIDIYFPASDTFLSACFGLIDHSDSRSAKYFPWFESYADNTADPHLHASCYEVDLVATKRQLIAFSKPLLLSDGVAFEPCIIAFSMERSKLASMLSIQPDTLPFYMEDSAGHRVALQEGGTAEAAELIASALGRDGFRVLRALPSVLQSRVNDLLLMFGAGLALVFLISCLAGYLMSWRISAPLRVLVRHLRRRYDQSIEPRQSELAFILHAVSGLSEHTDHLEEALNQSRLIARQNFLHALLHGAAGSAQDIRRSMDQCALAFDCPYFSVVVARFGEAVVSMMDGQDMQILRASIHSRLTAYSREDLTIHIIETEPQTLQLLVNHRQSDVAQRLQRMLEECFGRDDSALHSVVSGMSQPAAQPEEIGRAFEQAMDALQQQFFCPDQNFFVYSAQESPLPGACGELRHTFIKALDAQNIPGALEALLQTIGLLQGSGLAVPAEAKLNVLRDDWQLLGWLPLPEQIGHLEDYQNAEKLHRSLQRIIEMYRDQADQAKTLRKQQLVNLVTAYIDAHLADVLSLSDAAEHVGLSASYLSRIFKEAIGENFNEYVNTRRMIVAQQMLISTNGTVDEIARSLSFSSSNYFIKRFKQHFGITPAAYRAQQLNQQQE